MRVPAKYLAVGVVAFGSLFVARENIVLPAYQDIVGVWTIGGGSTRYENGKPVKSGDKVTPARAVLLMVHDVDAHTKGVQKCFGEVPLYPHELEAYAALAHNVGVSAVCNSSIPRKLKAGQYAEACKTIKDFNGVCITRENGKCIEKRVVKGLVNAREREYKWCVGIK